VERRFALVFAFLCAACGGPSVEDRIDALRAQGKGFEHNELPSAARMAELYPGAAPESLARPQDDLFGHADARAILDAGPAAVPDLVRLLDHPKRRRLAAGFLAETGGTPAAAALLAQWRRHRGAIANTDVFRTEDARTTYGTRYEPADDGYFAEVIYGLCVTGRAVSAEVARDTAAAMDEAERLKAGGDALHRTEERAEGGLRARVVTPAEPVETACEGLHILAMSGAPEGPTAFVRGLRSPVERIQRTAVVDVRYLGRGEDQTLPALAPLLDTTDLPDRWAVVNAVAFLTDRAAIPMHPSATELDALADRYETLLRERGHLPR
jgi:hypothetical protein